jgi:hypothetical protein
MRHGKQIRSIVRSIPGEGDAPAAITLPPAGSRPTRLETSRAGLLRCLTHEPTVSRSVGLVR